MIEQQLNTRGLMLRNNNGVMQNSTQRQTDQHRPRNNPSTQWATNSFQNTPPRFQTVPTTSRQNFPNQPIAIKPQPIQHRFPTNQQVFGKPRNVFQPNPHSRFEKPQPMSGVSIIPKRKFQGPVNPQPQNTERQNFWRNNPHANPLQFTEIAHLEENYPMENPDETEQYDHYHEQTNCVNYTPDLYYQDDSQEYYYYDQFSQDSSKENFNENFPTDASQKDNPS